MKKLYYTFKHIQAREWIDYNTSRNFIKRSQQKSFLFQEQHKKINRWRAFSLFSTGYTSLYSEEWDRIGYSESIEFRHPFCDSRLIKFCLSIPEGQLAQDLEPKGILRKALGDRLPELIKNRMNKTCFNHILNQQLAIDKQDKIRQILSSSCLEHLGLVNGEKVKKLYNDFHEKCIKVSDRSNIFHLQLWYLLVLETWAKNIINETNDKNTQIGFQSKTPCYTK